MRKVNLILSIFKGILSLSIIALVCTVLLGVVNILTVIDPLQVASEQFTKLSGEQYAEIKEANWMGNNGKVLYYAQSTNGSVEAFLSQGNGGFGGPVEIYIFVKSKKITQIELGNHSETYINTHLRPNGYFEQYIGKDINTLQESNIDLVSNATLSSKAIRNAVFAVAGYYTNVLNTSQTPTSSLGGDTITASRQVSMLENTSNMSAQLSYSGADFDINPSSNNAVNLLSIQEQNSGISNLKQLKHNTSIFENIPINSFNNTVEWNQFHKQGGGFLWKKI